MDTPRDDLVRALMPGPELRADTDTGLGTLAGHFCVFDQWTEINSWYEGRFLERIAPGAAAKTIREHWAAKHPRVKVLYDHGYDPQIGNKVLGDLDVLEEDAIGVRYESSLFDTSYNRDLVPGLTAGVYGSSFRFRAIKEEWNDEPGRSGHNPDGLPERSILEFALYEGGPVTFPAYEGATAGMRSLTDQWLARRLSPAELEALRSTRTGTPSGAADPATPDGAGDPVTEPPGHSTRTTTIPQALMRLAELKEF